MEAEISTIKYLLDNCDSDISELEHLVSAKEEMA